MKLLRPVPITAPLTQGYGDNPKSYPKTGGHNGLDWGIPEGTPIRATADGLVTVAGMDSTGYGLHVRIQHTEWLSIYGHLSRLAVSRDAKVKAGDIIGYSGNTGNSTGPHLHFEVRRASSIATSFDPTPYLVDTIEQIDRAAIFKARIVADVLNIRNRPDIRGGKVATYRKGDEVLILSIASDTYWLMTDKGFIAGKFGGEEYVEIVA